jgi:hypothetical protein
MVNFVNYEKTGSTCCKVRRKSGGFQSLNGESQVWQDENMAVATIETRNDFL